MAKTTLITPIAATEDLCKGAYPFLHPLSRCCGVRNRSYGMACSLRQTSERGSENTGRYCLICDEGSNTLTAFRNAKCFSPTATASVRR